MRARMPPIIASRLSALISIKAPHPRRRPAHRRQQQSLERIGFEAVILHEKANQGRTVIEKIEAHSDVGFAVVLLTPDDDGCLKGDAPQPRARQNVL